MSLFNRKPDPSKAVTLKRGARVLPKNLRTGKCAEEPGVAWDGVVSAGEWEDIDTIPGDVPAQSQAELDALAEIARAESNASAFESGY